MGTTPQGEPPDPRQASRVADLVRCLREVKVWAGDPTIRELVKRVNAGRHADGHDPHGMVTVSTVGYCFKPDRRRLDYDLVFDLLRAMGLAERYVDWWRLAWRTVFAPADPASTVAVLRQLPPEPADFVARAAELDRLLRTAAPVVSIEGMAGVGKSHLALRAGHELGRLGRHDEIRLYVNLRGFDLSAPPAATEAVLEGLLRALGVPGNHLPPDGPARARAYRNLMRGRRALVILDNAASEAQVAPLLPDSATCLVLVTSRRRLAALPGAAHLSLEVLGRTESLDLLRAAAGAGRVDAEPDAAARIAELCGHLPLALDLAGRHVRAHPDWTLADHVERRETLRHTLALDDAVEAALTLSYQEIPPIGRRVFRMLGLHPGHDITPLATAALCGLDLPTADRVLADLHAEHLIQQRIAGRYELHDLVRAYAASRVHDEEPPSRHRSALTDLFDHQLATAAAAMDVVVPHERDRRPRIAAPATAAVDFVDEADALGWLDAERANLLATARYAAEHGWPTHTGRLSTVLWRYLDTQARYTEALTLHQHALHAAQHHGDTAGVANALWYLAMVHSRSGRYGDALDHNLRALRAYDRAGDRTNVAHVLNGVGAMYRRLGDYGRALDYYQQALAVHREVGDRMGEGHALTNIGSLHRQSGRYDLAERDLQQALALCRRLASPAGIGYALGNLGALCRQRGRYEQAVERFTEALTLSRRLGSRAGEGLVLTNLGVTYTLWERYGCAFDHHGQALAISLEIGDLGLETETRNGLGEAATACGQPGDALDHHRRALELALRTGERYEQARAHDGLGQAHADLGDPDRARRHWRYAVDEYAALGVVGAEAVRAKLVPRGNTTSVRQSQTSTGTGTVPVDGFVHRDRCAVLRSVARAPLSLAAPSPPVRCDPGGSGS